MREYRSERGSGCIIWLGTMRTYVGQFNLIQRTVFVVNWSSLHGIQGGVCTIDDLSKDGVLAVQMGLFDVCYEELGLVRIWSRVGHGYHAAGVELGSEVIARGRERAPSVHRERREEKEAEGSHTAKDVRIYDGPRFLL